MGWSQHSDRQLLTPDTTRSESKTTHGRSNQRKHYRGGLNEPEASQFPDTNRRERAAEVGNSGGTKPSNVRRQTIAVVRYLPLSGRPDDPSSWLARLGCERRIIRSKS